MTDGKALGDMLQRGRKGGLPWLVILDASGTVPFTLDSVGVLSALDKGQGRGGGRVRGWGGGGDGPRRERRVSAA